MTALELRGISKHFGAIRALDAVDLRLEAGEAHALVRLYVGAPGDAMVIAVRHHPFDIGANPRKFNDADRGLAGAEHLAVCWRSTAAAEQHYDCASLDKISSSVFKKAGSSSRMGPYCMKRITPSLSRMKVAGRPMAANTSVETISGSRRTS